MMYKLQKIGIMTLHRTFNYGAVMQCWALTKACESLGYDVEVIDFNPYGRISILNALRHRPSVAYRYIRHMQVFGRFLKQNFKMTLYTESHEWIKNNPPLDDVYIVGSDMVWSKDLTEEISDAYYLDFAPDNVKRISYAASTGGGEIEVSDSQLKELRKFAAISVREQQSVASVQEKVDVPVIDVCDPTFLITKDIYTALEQKPLWLPKHYIVCYDLAGDALCTESTQLISSNFGLPIINIAGKYKRWAKYNFLAPTVEQWLYILHHADFVCTNSFHGVALSMIYERPFIYCETKVKGHAKGVGRIYNLLQQAGLLERYVTDYSQVRAIISGGVFEHTDNERFISQYRDRSLEWLKNALKDETNKE